MLDALARLDPDAAVFAVDEAREVVLWSPGAERLLGVPAAEALGRNCLASQRCVRCLSGDTLAEGGGGEERGQVTDEPLEVFHADGRQLPVIRQALAFHDAEGRFLGGVERLVLAERRPPSAPPLPLQAEGVQVFHGIVTRDPALKDVFQAVRNVAETVAPVLVRGESGTGKELVARAVHAESPRSGGPFVAVNCAALSPALLESELFGHVKGAFTGAVKDRSGLFRQAHGGTLFLDEVAELPLDLQAKLLRVLEEQQVTPVGATSPVAVDVRIISATHRSLRAEVDAGRFRQDLMFRLRVVPLFIPALRERVGDIELLLWHLIARQNEQGPRRIERVTPEAMRALLDHPWPGNVRELRNVVQYAAAVGRGSELLLSELPPELRGEGPPVRPAGAGAPQPAPVLEPAGTASTEPEDDAERIRWALQQTGGRVSAAAELLGVSRATFWRKRRDLGI
ncbi:MAG: sigma-54 interaction domain-containing protein [Planctomycetota bacterium]